MSQNAGRRIENAGSVVAQIYRLFLLGIAVSVVVIGAVVIAPVDRGKFTDEALAELRSRDRLSADVQRRLRSYLTVSAEPTDSAQTAIRRILKNVRNAHRQLEALERALDKTTLSDANRDLIGSVQSISEYHVNILNFN